MLNVPLRASRTQSVPIEADVGSPRFASIDALRGVAILQVFIWHYFDGHGPSIPCLGVFYNLTWSGVDLFFVLSGFLIGGILIDNKNSHRYYTTFYGRRLLRIMPLYAILLLLFFHSYPVGASLFNREWPYLTFTQNFLDAKLDDWGPQWTVVTWSLAVEEQFYLILPAMIRHAPKVWLPWIFAVLIAAAPLARWLFDNVVYHNSTAAYVLLPCRMDALFLGALAGWAMRQSSALAVLRRSRLMVCGAALLLGGLIVQISVRGHASPIEPLMDGLGLTAVALFCTMIVVLVATSPARGVPWMARPLCWLGFGAYSIYLFHLPVLQYVQHTLLPGPHGTIALALAAALNVPVALAAWFSIERPTIALGHRTFRYRTAFDRSASGEF